MELFDSDVNYFHYEFPYPGQNRQPIQPQWFGDGNFKVAPKIFKQLYPIRYLGEDNLAYTGAYILLQGKTATDYRSAFRQLFAAIGAQGLTNQMNCSGFNIDFELGTKKGFLDAWRSSAFRHLEPPSIQFYYFHLASNLRDKIGFKFNRQNQQLMLTAAIKALFNNTAHKIF
ncbi:hypothetical protein Ciccas_010752 [Cichlidogyrus casuarinus]|uniref:Uncharacterized protein n=1 Tax=Cichlidogyrus casuarinus TaxID=1844966 RepID=A0ABD2PV88_9PLAT